jgi:hypothetical protein
MEAQLATSTTFACGQCGAELVIGSDVRTTICPYCDAPTIVERPASFQRPEPVFVVGFVLDQKAAVARVHDWLGSRSIFAPGGLRQAEIEKTRSVYLPAYLYGAVAHSSYYVEIGERYKKGDEKKTEWRNLSGSHSCYVTDRIVTASRGLGNDELEAVEPYDLRAIRRYTPAMISGWIAEEASIPVQECLQMAHKESLRHVRDQIAAFMPGDSYRHLRSNVQLENEHLDLLLLPVWVFSARYDEDKPPVRVVVNGQTGKAAGHVPVSLAKVLIALAFVLAVAALIAVVLS